MPIKLNILLFLFLFSIIPSFGLAQSETASTDAVEQIKDSANDFELFLNEFENWNVGNLHVFTKPKETLLVDYYFKGEPINDDFLKFLSKDLQKIYDKTDGEVYAVGSIRGLGQNDLFIVRTNTKKRPHQLVLYRMVDKRLKPLQMLAYQRKTWWGATLQLDTWIQDVNGDTLLDLIQKGKKVNRKGKNVKEETRVYLQQDDGTFKYSKNVAINPTDYIFEKL